MEGTTVRVLRVIVVVAGLALVAAGCTGGGGYGGAVVAGATPTAAPTATPTTAPTATPTAAASPEKSSSGGGYSRGDYGYGTGASSGAAGSTTPGTVALSGYAFVPAALSVATGGTLTFTNGDAIAHAIVIGENGTPASGQTPQQVEAGGSISIKFPTAGTVKLTCTIHPSMNATVTVGP
jgi:plastocyanin